MTYNWSAVTPKPINNNINLADIMIIGISVANNMSVCIPWIGHSQNYNYNIVNRNTDCSNWYYELWIRVCDWASRTCKSWEHAYRKHAQLDTPTQCCKDQTFGLADSL